jgi:hypothetical protein
MPTPHTSLHLDGVLLRTARADDDTDLVRLAELEGARPLAGPALVAEENGAILAALCVSTGRTVADPFLPSQHLVELLRHHAARGQTPSAAPRRGRLLPRRPPRAGLRLIGVRRLW